VNKLNKKTGTNISKKEMARRILLALFLIYFLLLVIHISKAILDDRNPDHKETELNKGWLVMVDGKEYQDVDLDDFLPEKPLKRGDIVVLRNTIPDKIYNPAVVRLEMYLTTVTAYIDIGTIMMLTVSAMDIIRFNLQKYVAPEVKVLRISLIPFGVVLFVIILILSYLTYLYNILKEKASNESLRIMAYHDQLTGLYNRTKFEEMIEDYRDRKDMDYCLIIFDLDGLKITNDTYGHGMGDKLIKAFSDNVAASFEKYYNSTVMRIGGDEFVVMIDDVPDSEIKSRMEELHNLNVKSSEELGIPVRASYGYCAGKYTETGDPDEAYHLADSYMYTMKEAKKNSRK
jgi:diguanylate cyclase (GGDEF)-like protein